ncbi:unnamed protein product [Fraxinus pennsylvanica]|uniref:Uncharacterized protein n=1 Tax=Fraxinus pennsylvanica TaxID=56036 RepID=A0AAD1ZYY1_9LAMI|nr:unnamed protein product [Fraxinus pennsylvanica]
MIGQSVYGVTEGSIDAEYFITVMIGNNGSLLRGIVFLQGNIIPIIAANDVAPQAKMYLTISEMEYQNQVNAIEIIPRSKTVVMPNPKDVKRQYIDIFPIVPCEPPSSMPRKSSSSSLGKTIPIENAPSKDEDGSLIVLGSRDNHVPLKLEFGESTLGGRLY